MPKPRTAERQLRADPVLAAVMDRVAPLGAISGDQGAHGDLAMACRIIAGQQLSTRAAETIWSRARACAPSWDAAAVAALPPERLRACGLSGAKSSAIRALAARAACGEVDFAAIRALPDAQAVERLRAIKGFGPWSTEMFLIFALGRDDIFSVGDGGLRRAVSALYRVPARHYERRAPRIAEAWRPWRSLACRYLWAWLDRTDRGP
jgi:DNA-3-methyladenine glycosylase II